MISLRTNSTKKLVLLTVFVMHSCMIAETATLNTQENTLKQTEVAAQQTGTEVPTEQASQLDTLLNNVLQQTSQIDSLLQDIALVTSNNQSLSKEQRAAIAKEIRTLRGQIALFKNQSFTQADAQSIYFLLVINKELCDHLESALAKGFTSLDPFPFEKYYTRATTQPLVSINTLSEAITDSDISIAKLNRSAATIGLTWYNKIYRGIDGYLIQPWQKHSMTHYSCIALGSVAGAVALWWYFTERGSALPSTKKIVPIDSAALEQKAIEAACSCPLIGKSIDARDLTSELINQLTPAQEQTQLFSGTKLEQWLRAHMGPHPEYRKITINNGSDVQQITNYNKLKLPGYIEYNYGKAAFALAIANTLAWPKIKGDYYAFKNSFTKKAVELHNNLKGGVFKNRSIKTSFNDYFKTPTCTFDDIIGAENAKKIFSGVIDYLINPEKFDLAKTTPEKGYLLTGPSRTGKTYIAEAFAGEVRKRMADLGKDPETIRFLSAKQDEITALGGIKEYINFAKRHAPCILFIDEIDLLGLQRAGGNTGLLADFLVALSDFSQQDSDKQVIVIAATNRSENLDDALKRRGRLGVEIRFTYPSFEYRKDFFEHKLESIGISTETIDMDNLVQQTVGKSFNDLDSILKEALQQAKVKTRPLDIELLEQAIDSEIFHILPENDHPLSKQERLIVATTVAGQALVDHLLDTGAFAVRATINPYNTKLQEKSPFEDFLKEDSAKQQQDLIKHGKVFTISTYEFLHESLTSEQLKNTCKSLLAGRCAQKLILDITIHDKDATLNMRKSFSIAKELVDKGIDEKMLSESKRDSFSDKAYDLLDTLEQETTALLTEHEEQLKKLIVMLIKYGTLNREEIAFIIDGKLPEPLDPVIQTGTTNVTQYPAEA